MGAALLRGAGCRSGHALDVGRDVFVPGRARDGGAVGAGGESGWAPVLGPVSPLPAGFALRRRGASAAGEHEAVAACGRFDGADEGELQLLRDAVGLVEELAGFGLAARIGGLREQVHGEVVLRGGDAALVPDTFELREHLRAKNLDGT